MGTSGMYGGPSLEPPHLGDGNDSDNGTQNGGTESDENTSTEEESGNRKPGQEHDQKTQSSQDIQDSPKFSGARARSSFTRYTNSGGIHNLEKAVRGYVASSGGSSGTTRRMRSSTALASNLAHFVNRVVTEGAKQALEEFNLQSFTDRPAAEVFEALVDKIGPEGGTIDEAVARDSMIETIADFSSEDLGDFDQLTREHLGEFVVQVIAKSITTKVINEIGTNSLHGSASDADFQQAENTLEDYTLGAVRDSFQQELSLGETISSSQMNDKIKNIFSNAFEILQATLEDEQ